MDDTSRLLLKATIKGLTGEVRGVRRHAGTAPNEWRPQWQQVQCGLRTEARHHLLAYALLRGVPYATVERPAEYHAPNIERLRRIVARHGGATAEHDWTRDAILKWLTRGQPAAATASTA